MELNRHPIDPASVREHTSQAVALIMADAFFSAIWRKANVTEKRPEDCHPRGADEVEAGLPTKPRAYWELDA